MQPRHHVSTAAIALIKRFEGYRRSAARLADGRWTIGYGHTRSAREGARVSEDDAAALLLYDLGEVCVALHDLVFTPLSQNQFDALASFAMNIGVDDVPRLLSVAAPQRRRVAASRRRDRDVAQGRFRGRTDRRRRPGAPARRRKGTVSHSGQRLCADPHAGGAASDRSATGRRGRKSPPSSWPRLWTATCADGPAARATSRLSTPDRRPRRPRPLPRR